MRAGLVPQVYRVYLTPECSYWFHIETNSPLRADAPARLKDLSKDALGQLAGKATLGVSDAVSEKRKLQWLVDSDKAYHSAPQWDLRLMAKQDRAHHELRYDAILSARIDPFSAWTSSLGTKGTLKLKVAVPSWFRKHSKWKFHFLSVLDMKTTYDSLPELLGERCAVNVGWDENNQSFRRA